jgi:hypothetical protein
VQHTRPQIWPRLPRHPTPSAPQGRGRERRELARNRGIAPERPDPGSVDPGSVEEELRCTTFGWLALSLPELFPTPCPRSRKRARLQFRVFRYRDWCACGGIPFHGARR